MMNVLHDCGGPTVRANISPVRRNDGLGMRRSGMLAGRRSAPITCPVIGADLQPANIIQSSIPGPSRLRGSDRAGICSDLRPEIKIKNTY